MSETIRISLQDEELDAAIAKTETLIGKNRTLQQIQPTSLNDAIDRTEDLIQRNRVLETAGLRLIGMIPQLELVERLLRSLYNLSWQTPMVWTIMAGFGILSGIAGSYQRMSAEVEEQMRLNQRALDEQHRRGVPP